MEHLCRASKKPKKKKKEEEESKKPKSTEIQLTVTETSIPKKENTGTDLVEEVLILHQV